MESLAETRQRGHPSTKQLWAGTRLFKFSGFQSSHLTLSHFWRTQGQTSTSSYTWKRDLPSKTYPLLPKWPSPPKSIPELIVWPDSGCAVLKYCCYMSKKKAKSLSFKGHLPVYIPTSALLPKKNFLRSHWHIHTVAPSISSVSASNRGTEKLN